MSAHLKSVRFHINNTMLVTTGGITKYRCIDGIGFAKNITSLSSLQINLWNA